jgi:Kef-type K+ transport system membrane component KefB
MLSSIGLGFLFLLAGYELDLALFKERAGRLAGMSWLASLVGAAALLAGLYAVGVVHSPLVMAIAVTTTALGTLLPILRDNDMLDGRFGRYVFASGAVGELGPIVAMALFLGASGTLVEAVSLVVFLFVAYAVAVLPNRVRTTRIGEIIRRREHATSQTTFAAVNRVALLAAPGGQR